MMPLPVRASNQKCRFYLRERAFGAFVGIAANCLLICYVGGPTRMDLRDRFTRRKRDRFREFNTVVPILLAGWVPAILTLVVSYTILSNTLESKILRDRQTFVQLIAHLVGDDLAGKSSLIEYYQTLPEVGQVLSAPNVTAVGQQWLNQAFFSHPRIDGMFLTDAEGRLIASVPATPELIGQDFSSNLWREGALAASTAFVSPVHPRQPDRRPATDIVGAVRAPNQMLVGYLGVSVLVERIGRRLSTIEFADQSTCEILDQNGAAIFAKSEQPSPRAISDAAMLMKEIGRSKTGHFEQNRNLYSFNPVESTGWVAVVEQPKDVAYKPVHDLIARMTLLAAWLVVMTGVFAWLGTKFQRRQREAARRIEREVMFNEKILANVPSGIAFVHPTSRRFLQANEAFAQMARRFGNLPPERDITEATYTDVNIASLDALEKVLTFGAPFQMVEEPFKDKAGMTHFLNIHLLRLQDPKQTLQGVLYLVEDKTRDVTLRQELIDANAAKDQFLALLSHELRNPLTPVITMVDELEAGIPDSAANRQALEVIRRNVELEARLIDDLLDVTRIAKGKLQLTFELVCVPEILHRAYEICRDDIAGKSLKVEFQLRAKRAHVQGDPARLQQVFWNLIKNSVKFTPEKGHITIQTLNPSPDEIEIRIADTGIGIEQEKIDKIFNAFEQGQTSITRRFGGLGLGLAISKAMVDAHGGKIRVESPGKDQGSTFAITLKSVPEPVRRADGGDDGKPAPVRRKRSKPRGRRVLVVDDHHDTCLGMKMMLERRGYQITLAHSAEQAMEKARTENFDLLISDIGLPDRSGYDLMRDLGTNKGLRGIALSGFGTEHDVNKARQAGFSEHLTKPINFDRLEEAIHSLLEREAEPTSKS
jgi:signal transduction histidine kinase/CheY-like chemotaxis protein